jgi:hypothetical protein
MKFHECEDESELCRRVEHGNCECVAIFDDFGALPCCGDCPYAYPYHGCHCSYLNNIEAKDCHHRNKKEFEIK